MCYERQTPSYWQETSPILGNVNIFIAPFVILFPLAISIYQPWKSHLTSRMHHLGGFIRLVHSLQVGCFNSSILSCCLFMLPSVENSHNSAKVVHPMSLPSHPSKPPSFLQCKKWRFTVTKAWLHASHTIQMKYFMGKLVFQHCAWHLKHVQLSIISSQEPSQFPFGSTTHNLNHVYSK